MSRNCPTTSLIVAIVTIIAMITAITIMTGLLSCLAGKCLALPVWPMTEDPRGNTVNEDRIGYEDGSYLEFMDYTLDPNTVIVYRVGDDWCRFPHRLNAKKYTPHTVHILFEVSPATAALAGADVQAADIQGALDAQSLILAVRTDAPVYQQLGVFLDGYPIHQPGGEKIYPAAGFQEPVFQEHTFWLGYMTGGEHRITLSNETEPNSPYGIFFDYVKLVPGAKVGISLVTAAGDTATGDTAAGDTALGSTVAMENFTALEPNDPSISGSTLPGVHFYAGFWKFRITGLKQGDAGLGQGDTDPGPTQDDTSPGTTQGNGVKVEIHCPPESFFTLQEYYAYDGPEHGWKAMQIKKDPARFTVTVELSDGGAGDGDPNQGAISHIGGIAVPFSLGGGYGYRGCFIASLKR